METTAARMYITEGGRRNGCSPQPPPQPQQQQQQQQQLPTPLQQSKYASTSSIPASLARDASSIVLDRLRAPAPARPPAASDVPARRSPSPPPPTPPRGNGRRHSVLEDLKARRNSFFSQKPRRSSLLEAVGGGDDHPAVQKRRSSDQSANGGGGRRGSVFYVDHLPAEELRRLTGELVTNGGDGEAAKKTATGDESGDVVEEVSNKESSAEQQQPKSALELSMLRAVPLEERLPIDPAAAAAAAKKGRRKSWHPLAGKPPKIDKKVKRGAVSAGEVGSSAEGLYSGGSYNNNNNNNNGSSNNNNNSSGKQRRPTWWNIFVPDSVGRSRRMSQDVMQSRSTENLATSYFRSKSRSVDHGFTAPFDLDALRNKVEGRFESIDKLSRDSDNEGKDGSGSQEKKSGGRMSQPINTIAYTVGDRDTLTSVAARFDTTPSELSKLNRLVGTFVYSGQQLWVPAKGEGAPGGSLGGGGGGSAASSGTDAAQEQDGHQDDLPAEEKELLNNLRPVSPKPAHLERTRSPLGGASATSEAVHSYKERFLKITVRHITDGQGVVGGVLLVTPNAVMFDPNVSDPLVIEHGPESYGVIAPMEFIVNAAIYYDIAHMRVGHTETGQPDKKPEIYYMKKPATAATAASEAKEAAEAAETPSAADTGTADASSARKCGGGGGSGGSPGKDENFPELAVDDSVSIGSCNEREGDAFPKAFDKDLITPTGASDEASTKDKDKDDASAKDDIGGGQSSRTLEERRRSMLDHHWAVPSKDRCSFSVDDEQQDSLNSEKAESAKSNAIPEDEEGSLVKQSCHDSGIDIRDPNPPIPVVQPIVAKKVYSDADIVLSSDWVPPITIAPTNVTTTTLEAESAINGRKKASSVSFSLESNSEEHEKEEDHKEDDKQETRKNKMLKRLSYPLSWMEGLTGETKDEDSKPQTDKMSSLPSSADSHHSSVFSKVFSRRSSVGTFIRQQPLNSSGSSSVDSTRGSKAAAVQPRLDYRSMVSVEDMPELFLSFDKLIPRPARSCEDPPLYLRLRTGRPKDKKIPWSTPIMSYGKKKIRPEYWFSIPRNRVDDLYRFIHAWVPSLYGELDEDHWRERGYILSDTDTDLSPELTPRGAGEPGGEAGADGEAAADKEGDEEGKVGEISELTRESWEVLSMSEELRRALYANSAVSLDAEILVPDLVGATEILSDDHREHLCRHLPARAEGYVWTLVFSTSQHGFSLNSMYRKMAKIESPILLVIEDTEGNVFGALTSCSLRVSDHFYGTGESLLFRFTPRFQAFNWTGDNLYFIKGNNESLAIGAGDGKFGLWLDGDLYQGRTQSCSTYGNEPLAPHEDFVVKTLECWAFI